MGLRVAILGCGPAGLMAAHAANLAGASRIAIFSKRRKSELFGAQYLHSPIPGMTDSAPVTIRYQLKGSAEDYRRKVYGEQWDGSVSPEDLAEDHEGWDIRQTYNNLWAKYGDFVYGTDITHRWFANFMENEGSTFDLVVSSVPKHVICRTYEHTFSLKSVWAMGDAPERGIFVPYRDGINNNTVVCSGDEDDRWYRISKIFGYATVEWPDRRRGEGPPHAEASHLSKPLFNNCDCWEGNNVLHVGRFGRWEKGVLSDSSFRSVSDELLALRT